MPETFIWTDWIGARQTSCRKLVVKSRDQLVALLRNTPAIAGRRFHAFSTGHATSPVAQPVSGQFAVWLDRDAWISDPQGADWFKTEVFPDGTRPVWVPANKTIASLNEWLDRRALALGNLGSYDAQGIYGAIATGTHGSGMVSGPLADFVLSIDLTCVVQSAGAARVRSFRIEPTDGITKRNRFEDDVFDVELIQDDDVFHKSVVSLGALGVVTGLVLRVRPRFWLKETRKILPWASYKKSVLDGTSPDPTKHLYTDLVLTALPVKVKHQTAAHQVLVTTREVVPMPAGGAAPDRNDARSRSARAKWEANGHSTIETALHLSGLGSRAPRFANKCAFNRLVDDAKETFTSKSYKVFRSSIGDWVAATSGEMGVAENHWIDAVDGLIGELKKLDGDGLHPLSPIGIRFQKSSKHLLTQQHNRASTTFETPILIGAFRHPGSPNSSAASMKEILGRLEGVLIGATFQGRPHLGQRSEIDVARTRTAYGAATFDAFKANRMRFDPYGIFANPRTTELGL